jgi:hypothetical protein
MVIFEDIVYDRKSDNVASGLLAFFIMCAVYAGLAFTLGDKGPSGFAESAPYVFIIGVIAGIFAWKKKSTSKSHLKISRAEDKKYHIEVNAPLGSTVLAFGSPFAYRCGWDQVILGRGKKQRILYFVFSDKDGKSLLTLQYFLGVLDPLPDDWPQVTSSDVATFNNVYRSGKIKEIAYHFIYKGEDPHQKKKDDSGLPKIELNSDPFLPGVKVQDGSKDSEKH